MNMADGIKQRYLTTRQAAAYIGRAYRTLYNWKYFNDKMEKLGRPERQGPPCHKKGGNLYYDILELDDWVKSSRQTS